MTDLKIKALEYAKKGKSIFPIAPNGKKPITPNGYKNATTDINQIEKWWSQKPNANIGMPTGVINGLFVLDVDGVEGIKNLKHLEQGNKALPETRTVKTGGGGYHYYFKIPDGVTIKNSASLVAPNIDIRGDGGYIIMPPSIHNSGNAYRFNNNYLVADAPQWLIKLIVQSQRQVFRIETLDLSDTAIKRGKRNTSMTQIVGLLLNRLDDVNLAYQLCHAYNRFYIDPALSREEMNGILDSIAKRELVKRGVK